MTKRLLSLMEYIVVLALVIGVISTYWPKEIQATANIENLRSQHQNYLDDSPFTETLKWDKKKRKLNGLPPNRYFEQMYELTLNPSTGKLDDGELTALREQLIQARSASRSPGETGNEWVERGPNNVGGRTRAILFDPNDSSNNTVYAGGVSGGLWINTNISSSASTWSRVENVPGNLSVTSITVDPNNSNIWYMGTGEQYTAGDVVGNGVYKTTDGGTTWSAVNIPAADSGDIAYNASNLFLSGIYYVNDILAWDNGSNTELFVGVGAHAYGDSASPTNWLGLQSAGLYRSTDGGTSWSRVQSSNMQHSFGGETYYFIPNDLEVGADNKLWMGTIGSALGEGGGRVFSSVNGATWTEAAASPLTDSNRVELEPSATNANKIYVLSQGVSSPVHIYETTNGFASISSLSLPNDADTGIPANDFARGQAFYDLVIEADPSNDNILYVGGIDLFKSSNGGSSWSQLSHWYGGFGYQYVHADQHSIAFGNNSSTEMVYGNDGGMYYSGNAGSSIGVRNTGYNVTQFVKAGIGPDGNGDTDGIFSAGAQDNGTQAFRNATAGVNSSEELSDGDGFYTFVDKDGQYMIATYVYNVIYRFNLPWNGLGRIDGAATTLSSSQTTGDFVNPMDYDSDANRLLSNNSSGSSYSIRSINVAANTSGTLSNSALSSKPTAFRASPFASNTWYVGTENGSLLRLTGVGNSSASWTNITTPFVGSVSSVRFGETANDLIVTMHNYGVTSVWYSSNAGTSWVNKEGDLPNIPVRDFYLNPLNSNEAIIATQLGVWSTSNFGSSSPNWNQAYNGMSDVSVTSFDYWDVSGDDTDNKIIASTYGRGVFTGKFTATAEPDTEAPSSPSNLVASNPTQSSIDLNWDASTDNVGVSVYDVYRDDVLIASVPSNSYLSNGLAPNTTYSYYVIAKDAAGNLSPSSNTVTESTTAPDITAPTPPANLESSNITASSVDLNWTASTDDVAVASYDVYQDNVLITNVEQPGYQVSGLNADTVYAFQVKAKDDAGNESAGSNVLSVTTDDVPLIYCNSTSSNVSDEYIGNVQLNTIDNASGAQFYSDFTSESTILTKGDQYDITVTPVWTGTVYNEAYSVWIDYNRDGDFSDAGEQVWTQSPTQTTPVVGSFVVPESAVENSTRMRVSMKYNGVPTSCESFTYGEVEDYTVTIMASGPDTTPPSVPTNLTASNTTQTSTELNWTPSTDNVGVVGYDVYQDNVMITTVVSNSYQVSGLQATTTYAFYVVARDAENNMSNNSAVENVTTLDPPDFENPTPPVNLLASNTTQTTTDLSWGAASDNVGVVSYQVYKGAVLEATIAGTNYQVLGLAPSTSYSFSVRAVDAANNVSQESNVVDVTTLDFVDIDPPTDPVNLVASNTTEVSTELSWDASSDNVGVDSYDVFQDGSYIATVGTTNYAVSGLSESTNYVFTVFALDAAGNVSNSSNALNVTTLAFPKCDDGIQNGDETGVDCGGSCEPCAVGPEIVHEGYFETGWDGWVDGGSDCFRYTGTRSAEGVYSIRIRDNSGTASAMTSPAFNLASFNQVELKFSFYARSMENNEDFWVRYYNGSSWSTIATYVRGADFNNNTFYDVTLTLDAAQFTFASNSGFRFQCDASGNNDQIYIDKVIVTGIGAGSVAQPENAIVSTGIFDDDTTNEFEDDFLIYPNPVKGGKMYVKIPGDINSKYRIISMTGRTIAQGASSKEINVSGLKGGVYFIEVFDGDEVLIQKFIKQ